MGASMTRAADYLSRLSEKLAGYHTIYMDRIRGDNPRAFTRKRKVLPLTVTVQILTQRGKAQRSEVDTVMRSIGADIEITDVGFYKARMKFDPEAIRRMSYDFVDSEMLLRKDELSRHGGYFVFAIDGSDVTLPSNIISDRIGKKGPAGPDGTTEDMPVQCKVSCLSDVLNHLIVRTEVDEYNHDERDHAMKLLKSTPEWLRKKALVVFDRGYYSIPLILCLEDLGFFYCFRLSSCYLRKEQAQTEVGQVRDIEVKPTLASTNGFRDDDELRKRCLERTFRMRMAKIDIGSEEGPEVLVTNLPPEDSDAEAMKKIYHCRWDIETAYRVCKKQLELEEFSGRRERLILQDIYGCMWMYDIIQLYVLSLDPPAKKWKWKTKINGNAAAGLMKSNLARAVMHPDAEERRKASEFLERQIPKYVCPVRPDRKYSRKRCRQKNHSRMSYRRNC